MNNEPDKGGEVNRALAESPPGCRGFYIEKQFRNEQGCETYDVVESSEVDAIRITP